MTQNWSDRMEALKNIDKSFSTLLVKHDWENKIPEDSLRVIMEKIADRFDDAHAKVQESALKLIHSCFEIFLTQLDVVLGKLFCKILFSLAEGRDGPKKIGRELLDKLFDNLSKRDLVDQCLRSFHNLSNVQAQLYCLQVMATAIQDMKTNEFSGILVKNVISKVSFVFKEKTDKKYSDAVMKVIKNALLKNGEASREYFTLLSPSLQNKVKYLLT